MNDRNLTRRASLIGLAALVLGGCDRFGSAPPARMATVKVDTSAKAAFVAAVQRFAAVRHFALTTSGSQATLKLSRADMEITLSNKDAVLAWQVICDNSHGASRATPAEIDEMADELLANMLAVKGVELINSDKPVCGVANKASGGFGLVRNCDPKS